MSNTSVKRSNAIWMGALAFLIVLSIADALFLSSCDSGSSQASQAQEGEQGQTQQQAAQSAADQGTSQESTKGVNYLVLVNKTHELDENWENEINLVEATNQRGTTIAVEEKALEAFEELQKELRQKGVVIDLNSCYRSRKEQQELVDKFTEEYGSDYVDKYVAKAGHSEHETGLALDVIPIVDGVEMLSNEEMFAQTDLWKTVHSIMPKYGFILRYLPNQEAITGYEYEPWHLRYVGTPDAQKITDSGKTLEEYLGEA